MKILLYSDNHWSQYSSIVRKRGKKYSLRLENQIQSINWVHYIAKQLNCNAIFCLGDFFDKSELNSEEITALREVNWLSRMPYYFIVGNHEMGSHNHQFSSMKLFNLLEKYTVIDIPKEINICDDLVEIYVLPYITEDDRKSLKEYIPPKTDKKRIILSHNDLKGIQINGAFVSKTGFDIEEIESLCDLFINGHLHNGYQVSKKIINIGNLTGQNFSENADKYPHVIFVLDTETLRVDVYENPCALNFYKLEIDENNLDVIDNLKTNSIVTIKCSDSLYDIVKTKVLSNENILESRIIINRVQNAYSNITEDNLISLDHLQEFRNYILETLGRNEIIEAELSEVTSL